MASATFVMDDELLALARAMKPEEIASRFRCAACSRMNIGAAKLPCCKESVCEDCQATTKSKCPVCELELEGDFSFEEHKTMRKSVYAFVKGVAQKRKLAAAKAASTGNADTVKASTPATPQTPLVPALASSSAPSHDKQRNKEKGAAPSDSQDTVAQDTVQTSQDAELPDAQEDPLPSREQISAASEEVQRENKADGDNASADMDEGSSSSSESTVIETEAKPSIASEHPLRAQSSFNTEEMQAPGEGQSNMGFNNANWANMANMNQMMAMSNMMGFNGFPNMMNMTGMNMDPSMMGFNNFGMNAMNSMGYGDWNNGMNMNMSMNGMTGGYDQYSGGYGGRGRYGNSFQQGYRGRGPGNRGYGRGSYGSYNGGYGNTGQYNGSNSGRHNGDYGGSEAAELTPGQANEAGPNAGNEEGITAGIEGIKVEGAHEGSEIKALDENAPTESNLNQVASFDAHDEGENVAMARNGQSGHEATDGSGLKREVSPPGPNVPQGPSAHFGAARGRGSLRGGNFAPRGRGVPAATPAAPGAGVAGAPTGPKALRDGPAGRGFRGGARGVGQPDASGGRIEGIRGSSVRVAHNATRDNRRYAKPKAKRTKQLGFASDLLQKLTSSSIQYSPPQSPHHASEVGARINGIHEEDDTSRDHASSRRRTRSPRRSEHGHQEGSKDVPVKPHIIHADAHQEERRGGGSRRDTDRHRSSRHERSRERRRRRHRSRSRSVEDDRDSEYDRRRHERRRDRNSEHDRYRERDRNDDDRRSSRRHSKRERSASPYAIPASVQDHRIDINFAVRTSARPREFKIQGRSQRNELDLQREALQAASPALDPHAVEREARNRERLLKEQQRRGETGRKRTFGDYDGGNDDDDNDQQAALHHYSHHRSSKSEHSSRRRKRDHGSSSGRSRRGGVYSEGDVMASIDAAEDAREAGRWD